MIGLAAWFGKHAEGLCSAGARVCRTSSRAHTRRALAPAYCLAVSKTRRKRGRPAGDGAGGSGDDGGGGGGSGSDGFGWDGWDGAGWGGGADGVWLWQALCMCSLLQARVTSSTSVKASASRYSIVCSWSAGTALAGLDTRHVRGVW